jgi:hypothetical protein
MAGHGIDGGGEREIGAAWALSRARVDELQFLAGFGGRADSTARAGHGWALATAPTQRGRGAASTGCD